MKIGYCDIEIQRDSDFVFTVSFILRSVRCENTVVHFENSVGALGDLHIVGYDYECLREQLLCFQKKKELR